MSHGIYGIQPNLLGAVQDAMGGIGPRDRHPLGYTQRQLLSYLNDGLPLKGGGHLFRGRGDWWNRGSRGLGGSANVYYNTSSRNLFGGMTNFGINGSFGRGSGWADPFLGWNPGWNPGGIDIGYNTTSFGPNSASNFGINGFIPGGSVPKTVGNIAGLGALWVLGYALLS